ncbi:MAG TPA: DUF1761 domain-containing protein [Candidatus Saccharimonadia bacterium]|jgi:hypothetical protein
MWFSAHWWQVILAVIAYFAVGSVWYSSALFARTWAHELGKKTGETDSASTAMFATLGAMIVLVLVEAYMVQATGTTSAWRGAYLGGKLWLGFTATTALVNNVFQGASKKLFFIDQGYHLVGMVLAGLILAL